METTKSRRFFYGFYIVMVYCIVLPAIFLFSNPIGMFMNPICEELGMTQGIYSLTRTFSSIVCAASYLFYVPLEKKIGVRMMICLGILCGALAAFTYSTATGLLGIFVAATFNALINPLASQISMGNIVNAWFARRTATVMSIIFTSGNIGGLLNVKLIAFWITTDGWRASMRNIMLILLAVAGLAFLVIRNTPAEKGLQAWGTTAGDADNPPSDLPGAVYCRTKRHPKYYCLLIWAFMTGLITYPVINIVPALLQMLGYDIMFSGTVVGMISFGSLILLPLLGLSVDRWGVRPAGVFFAVMYFVSIVAFLKLEPARAGQALFAGLTLGIANILFPMLPMFIKELFGFRDYSIYMSQANILRMLGTAIGYPLLGFIHDFTGSYDMAFCVLGLCAAIMLFTGFVASNMNNPLWEETRPGYHGNKNESSTKKMAQA